MHARKNAIKIQYASVIVVGPPEESPWPLGYFGERSIKLIELVQEGRTSNALQHQASALRETYPEAEIAYYDNAGSRHVFDK
jgi:hypothetical protein